MPGRLLLRFLAFLGRHGPALLVVGIVLGVALPRLAALLRPYLPALVFLLAAATMIRIDWPQVAAHFRQPLRIGLVLAWGLLASPVIMAAAVARIGLPAGLDHAVVVWSASPTLISAPALAFLLGLDGSLALIAMVLGSLLMPLTLPPIVLGLLGVRLAIGIPALMVRLVLFIGGAVLVAALARRVLGPRRIARLAGEINGFNVLLLMVFAIAIMEGVPQLWASRPHELLLYAAAAFAAALAEQLIGTLVFLRCGRVPALTVGMVCGNRNMASVWASLGALAPPELTLFLVTVQLPIYILPIALRPVYRALATKRCSGAR
jgi:BASS family bile acid:Na+ symporter